MRHDLAAGGHVVFRDRLTYDQGRRVRRALLAKEIDRLAMADLDLELVGAYVESWEVRDLDGNLVDLATPAKAPDDVIQEIAIQAIALWKGRPDVGKAMGGPSPNSSPARR